ncbi:hypothetical protein [Bradyrhizobium elkanii]|uniref:hypothetical protein n=1 Tax=Bradyrhizobium elkanii TaxID=29448 RepID=UPI001BAB7F53|nr:hypothetical protein [Bradyrhizobium elkanii]MBR1158495.1 hypothetical protein [Bradyrhizobium elkanii]
MLRCIRVTAVTLAAVLMSTVAGSAQTCASRSDFVTFLKDHFGEVEVDRGLSDRGHLVEVFVSPAGTWTILLSRPDGSSCLVDAGEAWTTAVTPSRDVRLLRFVVPGPVD